MGMARDCRRPVKCCARMQLHPAEPCCGAKLGVLDASGKVQSYQ